jgi:hypothetical protein
MPYQQGCPVAPRGLLTQVKVMGSFAVPRAIKSPRTTNLQYPENLMVVPGLMTHVTLSGTSKLAERIVSREMFIDSFLAHEEVSNVRIMIMDKEIVFIVFLIEIKI